MARTPEPHARAGGAAKSKSGEPWGGAAEFFHPITGVTWKRVGIDQDDDFATDGFR